MASLFRARRSPSEKPAGAGGKVLRGRRAASRDSAASPYSRPPVRSPPAASAQPQSQSPRWFSGLLSGAGKLISSVFGSPSSPSSSSEDDYTSDEEDAVCLSPKEQNVHDQMGDRSEVARECTEGFLAIVPKNESKLVIEQLLNQEAFSRDESTKLIKLIQSRVVNSLSPEDGDDGRKDVPDSDIHNAAAIPKARQSTNLTRTLPTTPYSTSHFGALSSGSPSFRIYSPDLCNTAVMEAKKWVEEKKLVSSSKSDPDCGPCVLNTDMHDYDIDTGVGSPVDMAKSYMQSLPPWRSPLISEVGFKTPPAGSMRLYKDESSCETAHHSSLSSKVLKRNYLAIGSRDISADIRKVRPKLTNDNSGFTKVKQIESVARSADYGLSKSSSVALNRNIGLLSSNHDLRPSAATEKIECSYRALRLCEKEAVGGNNLCEKGRSTPNDPIFEPKKDVNVTNGTHEGPKLAFYSRKPTHSEAGKKHSPATHSEAGNETKSPPHFEESTEQRSSDPDVILVDENNDVEEPVQNKGQVCDIPAPVLPSLSANVDEGLLDGTNLLPQNHMKPNGSRDHDDASNHMNVHYSTEQGSLEVGRKPQAANSLEANIAFAPGDMHSVGDGRGHNGNAEMHKANGSMDPNTTKGEERDSDATNSASIEPSVGVSERAFDTSATNPVADQSENGMRMKSIERMLAETQPNKGRRARKAVVKTRRGKGRER